MESANTSFRVFVSPAILVSRSPERARLWKDNDRACKCANSSRRNA